MHSGDVLAAAFSPDTRTILTGSWDKTARFWDVRTGAQRGPALQHADRVWSVAFSPDGQRAVTGCADGTVRLWPVPPPAMDDPQHPQRLRKSVEARTAMQIQQIKDKLQTVPLMHEKWIELRKQLMEMGGPCDAPTWQEYNSWQEK